MSISTHVYGFRPPDEKWKAMKAVWDSCEAAGIPVPDGVYQFFNWDKPDPAGVKVSLDTAATTWSEAGKAGYEVELAKLPPDVKIIRFYNSW